MIQSWQVPSAKIKYLEVIFLKIIKWEEMLLIKDKDYTNAYTDIYSL